MRAGKEVEEEEAATRAEKKKKATALSPSRASLAFALHRHSLSLLSDLLLFPHLASACSTFRLRLSDGRDHALGFSEENDGR